MRVSEIVTLWSICHLPDLITCSTAHIRHNSIFILIFFFYYTKPWYYQGSVPAMQRDHKSGFDWDNPFSSFAASQATQSVRGTRSATRGRRSGRGGNRNSTKLSGQRYNSNWQDQDRPLCFDQPVTSGYGSSTSDEAIRINRNMPDDDILQRLGIKKETVKKWDELESEEMFSRSLGESKSISESLEAMPGLELALVEASVATSIDSDQINSKELYKFKTMMELLNYPNGIAINRLQAKIQCNIKNLKRLVRSRFIIKIQVTGNTMKRDTAHRNKVRNPSADGI